MAIQQPKRPTAYFVERYIEQFEQSPQYSSADKALSKLFAAFPLNQHLDDVLLKVSALNSLYSTSIYGIYQVAQHICELQIDTQLERNSPEVVNNISHVNIGGKPRHIYSFATKYCSWHKPDAYPMYDGFVEQLIVSYQRLDGFARFNRNELRDYPRYREIVERFRTYYDLAQFNFKQLDKFLWMYGRELAKRNGDSKV